MFIDEESKNRVGKYWCEHSLMQIPWDRVKGEMRDAILEHAEDILKELYILGYRKLPDKPPPLLTEDESDGLDELGLLEAQREADIKHYTE